MGRLHTLSLAAELLAKLSKQMKHDEFIKHVQRLLSSIHGKRQSMLPALHWKR